jgi:hypothetical protein
VLTPRWLQYLIDFGNQIRRHLTGVSPQTGDERQSTSALCLHAFTIAIDRNEDFHSDLTARALLQDFGWIQLISAGIDFY